MSDTNNFYKEAIKLLQQIAGGVGNIVGGTGGSIGGGTGEATESTLQAVNNKLPPLSSGRLPVQVESLNISFANNTSLEISNDIGNPVPVTISQANAVLLQTFNLAINTNYSLSISSYYPCLLFQIKASSGSTVISSIAVDGIAQSVFYSNNPESRGSMQAGPSSDGYLFNSGLGILTFSTSTSVGTASVLKVYGLTDASSTTKGLGYMLNYWLNSIQNHTSGILSYLGTLTAQAKTVPLTCQILNVVATTTPVTDTTGSNIYQFSVRVLKGSASVTLNGSTWNFNADEFNLQSLNPSGYPRSFTWTESTRGTYPSFSYTVDQNSSAYFEIRRSS